MVRRASRHKDVVHLLEGDILYFTKLNLRRKAAILLSKFHIPHAFITDQLIKRDGIQNGSIVILYV